LREPRQRIDRLSVFAGTINPFTRQRAPEAPADKRVLYVELSYPFVCEYSVFIVTGGGLSCDKGLPYSECLGWSNHE
jgi:hypothetical protein